MPLRDGNRNRPHRPPAPFLASCRRHDWWLEVAASWKTRMERLELCSLCAAVALSQVFSAGNEEDRGPKVQHPRASPRMGVALLNAISLMSTGHRYMHQINILHSLSQVSSQVAQVQVLHSFGRLSSQVSTHIMSIDCTLSARCLVKCVGTIEPRAIFCYIREHFWSRAASPPQLHAHWIKLASWRDLAASRVESSRTCVLRCVSCIHSRFLISHLPQPELLTLTKSTATCVHMQPLDMEKLVLSCRGTSSSFSPVSASARGPSACRFPLLPYH